MPPTSSVRVQIVDGDGEFAAQLSTYLRTAGLQVSLAAEGDAALARMKVSVPDVLLVDCALPESRRLVEACRAEPRLSCVPVILLSAGDGLSQATAELGARAGLAKPIDLDVLMAVVKLVGRR
jgi:two-component system, OmpR family, response regulator RegX3